MKQKRPVFLNLWQIRLPVTAIMSILHRISGVALFLVLPLLVITLERSLKDPAGFQSLIECLDNLAVKVLLVILCWSLLHHLFAGARYLLLDVDVGIQRPQARATAWLVMLLALALSVVVIGVSL